MGARVGSAAVGLPLLAGAIWVGGWWFSVLVAVAAAVGAIEVCHMARGLGWRPVALLAATGSLALVALGHFLAEGPSLQPPVPAIVGTAALAYLVWQLVRPGAGSGIGSWGVTIAASVYTGGLLFYGPLLRGLDEGREWVFLAVMVTFVADTAAFFVGRAIGKRPLAAAVSPAKTWEGAIAGLVAAGAATVAASAGFALELSLVGAVALGALLGVAGQLGDLAESKLKRAAAAKESGWIVPGHGGVLDRLDSIVFNLALVYHFVIWTGL